MCMGTRMTECDGMNATIAHWPGILVSGQLLFRALWLGNTVSASWTLSCKVHLACGKEVLSFYVMCATHEDCSLA